MQLYKLFDKVKLVGKYLLASIFLLNLISLTFATSPLSNIQTMISAICGGAKGLLGVGMMLMIILAGVIYAVGQIMGAETRARATVWATAMLTGALIAAIIYLLAPWITQQIVPTISGSISC